MDKVLLDLKVAREKSGLSIRLLRKLIRGHKLNASRIGRSYYLTQKSLDKMIKESEV